MVEQIVLTVRANEIEAEIRRVSLLFADIRGSTELVQHLDPEAAANMLGPPMQAMIEEVERFEGVASDRGDGIMAVFGAPSASEDHAIRACLAALAIQDRLSANAATPVKVRIGIHFGEVVFRRGRIGKLRMQDVFGAAAHIAARLEQTTEPGTICLSRVAYELAQGFVTAVPLAPVQVKGIAEPIERLQLISADQTANRWEVQAGKGLAPFTGRSKELGALARAFATSGSPGVRLIQIIGPAGMGKSRLVHEFLATEAARRRQLVKFVGDPRRQNVAYYPISVWLRGLLDIRSADLAGDARNKLARLLSQLEIIADDERDHIQRMLGLGDRIQSDIADLATKKSFRVDGLIGTIISRVTAGRPLILTCEDIDYFDPASLELIPPLTNVLRDSSVFLVTTSRARSRLQSMNVSFSRTLTLSALADDDAKQLLADLHPDLRRSSALTATIVQKAGGNPLFLEEVTSLIASVEQEGRHVGSSGATIPDRVEALIADRLGRLPKQRRRLVQACAVIGFDVPLRIAAKLLEVPEGELHTRLAKLGSEQLLYETRKYPDPQFTFKHALTRDVAYNTMLPSKRREYHARIVEILEEEATQSHDSHVDDLCMHAVHAQAWTKAVTYLPLAAGMAVERSSFELAEVYLKRALEICKELPVDADTLRPRIEILLGLSGLGGANSKNVEANQLLDLAEGLAARLGDQELLLRIMVKRVYVLNVLGELDAAVVLAKRAQELGRALGHVGMLAGATYNLGQANFNLGNFTLAEDALSDAVELLAQIPNAGPTGTLGTLPVLTHVTRTLVRAFSGNFAEAADDAQMAKNYARESRRPYDLSFAAFAEGFLQLQRRDGVGAVKAFRECLVVGESREMADPSALPLLLRTAGIKELRQFEKSRVVLPHYQIGLAHALLLNGDIHGASQWLLQGYENARRTNRYMVQVWAAAGLAQVHLATGQVGFARRYAEEAAELALKYGFKGFAVSALRVRGRVRANADDSKTKAIDDLRAALALASMLGMRAEIAHCHVALAWSHDGYDVLHFHTAQDMYRDLQMTQWFECLQSMKKAGHIVGL